MSGDAETRIPGRQPVIMVCTSDLAGQFRGKGFPAADLETRLQRGVGWVPTNSMITALGPIADGPWGSFGDLLLLPDGETEVRLPMPDNQSDLWFYHGDIVELDGQPWSCCPRNFLKRAIAALQHDTGLHLHCAFEHEFMLVDAPARRNHAYNLEAYRGVAPFAENLMAALESVGAAPEMFMPEYAGQQFEITCQATGALEAADRAVTLRQVTRAVAAANGNHATFVPVRDPDGVGNGVHVHFSLRDEDGQPVNHNPDRPHGLGEILGAFTAGIQRHMHAIVALSAPSPISYMRLVPNRWSASFNNVGYRDREAALRICPFDSRNPDAVASAYNMEFRAADAAATPHMLLAGLIYAGLDGIRNRWETPQITESDPNKMKGKERISYGISLLPRTLNRALDALDASESMTDWMGGPLKTAYFLHKRFELGLVAENDAFQQCEMYSEVY